MRRILITALLIFICFLMQCTVFQVLAFGLIVPNLMIVLTSSYGFMRGEKDGLLIGFFCGLLVDIFFGSVIGFYALIYMYIGYANGKFCPIFFPEDIKLPIILIICSDFLYGAACYITLFLLRRRYDFSYYLAHIIVPEIVYTVVVTLFLYPVILEINNKLVQREKRSEKKFV